MFPFQSFHPFCPSFFLLFSLSCSLSPLSVPLSFPFFPLFPLLTFLLFHYLSLSQSFFPSTLSPLTFPLPLPSFGRPLSLLSISPSPPSGRLSCGHIHFAASQQRHKSLLVAVRGATLSLGFILLQPGTSCFAGVYSYSASPEFNLALVLSAFICFSYVDSSLPSLGYSLFFSLFFSSNWVVFCKGYSCCSKL